MAEHPVDRENRLREAQSREDVAAALEACAVVLAELGESFSPRELRDEAEFQRLEARDLRSKEDLREQIRAMSDPKAGS